MSASASDQTQMRLARLRVLLWIGGIGAALAAIGGVFGFGDGSIWKLPRVLQSHVEAALGAAGMPGLEVDMQGQTAVLTGVVGNTSSRALASHLALTAAGPGGAWAGGVTSADTRGISVGQIERPFSWSVSRQGRQVTLSGVAPSMEARRTLHAIAIATFPNAVPADKMRVAGGAPSAHWRDAAADAIAALAPFENAEVHFDDENITFTVQGSQAAIANLRQHYQSPPAAFNARIDVTETMP